MKGGINEKYQENGKHISMNLL